MSTDEKLFDLRVRSSLAEKPLLGEFVSLWNESKNFEAGFYCVQALVQNGETEQARAVIDEMRKILKTYKNFSRSIGAEWLRKAQALV